MVTSSDNLFLLTQPAWIQHLSAEKIVVRPALTFEAESFQSAALEEIRRSNVRVVIALACSSDTMTLALAARKLGMTSRGWAWIGDVTVIGAEQADMITSDALIENAKDALHGWIYLAVFKKSSAIIDEFYEQVKDYGRRDFNLSKDVTARDIDAFAASLYDAVFLFAHAATRMLSEGGDVQDGKLMVQTMHNISFDGIQGAVALDKKYRRTDGRTGRRTDGQTDGRTGGPTD